ncbi:hypothetical protein [Pseudomonas coronafaciens]|uniref:hypothetical protein n=1 Tax=Pseudomonas coronafaciens TaxID=53409 RepID=UPI001CC1DFEF|nr:hypothetical protein [Pseudomonas coronafaciens]
MKLIFAMLLMFSAYTFASCSSISDHDERAYFKAKQGGGSCTTIMIMIYALNASR